MSTTTNRRARRGSRGWAPEFAEYGRPFSPLGLLIAAVRPRQRSSIQHPDLGPITHDCDVLTAAGTDLKVVVYTANPSSPDADNLDLIRYSASRR